MMCRGTARLAEPFSEHRRRETHQLPSAARAACAALPVGRAKEGQPALRVYDGRLLTAMRPMFVSKSRGAGVEEGKPRSSFELPLD